MQHQGPTNAPGDILRLSVPVGLKRVGREMRMLVENADDQTAADPSLLRIIARAHHIQARLIQNPKLTVHDIAREERVSAAYLYTLLRLPWLAPGITTAIINGRNVVSPSLQLAWVIALGDGKRGRSCPWADYPRTFQEVDEWFRGDAACREYIRRLRWPGGFICPH